MAKYVTTDTSITSIANAIRTKGGTSEALTYPNGFVNAINNIPSGGGGGLTYETGTYTPASDTTSATISFSDTHTSPPFFYMIIDCSSTALETEWSAISDIYCNIAQAFADVTSYNGSNIYGYVLRIYSGNSAPIGGNPVSNTVKLNTAYNDTSSSTSVESQYWSTNTGIKAEANTRSLKAGRTYKWIAVWPPET